MICYIPSFDMQMFKIRIIPLSLPATLFKIIGVACTMYIRTSILLLENLYDIHLRFRIAN